MAAPRGASTMGAMGNDDYERVLARDAVYQELRTIARRFRMLERDYQLACERLAELDADLVYLRRRLIPDPQAPIAAQPQDARALETRRRHRLVRHRARVQAAP